MIITLITIIMTMFGGGSDDFFLVPKGQKLIKSEIESKEKANDAVIHYKTASKAIKAFNKQNKKDRKELVKLQSNRKTTRLTLEKKYDQAFDSRKQLQEKLADTRLKIRELMTKDEWEGFIANALTELEKKDKKTQKQDVKTINQAKKNLNKIDTAIKEQVKDKERRQDASEAFSIFEGKILKLAEETNSLKFNSNRTLQSYDANREDLIQVFNSMNDAQDQAFEALLDLRDELVQDITAEEWNSISKSLKRVF